MKPISFGVCGLGRIGASHCRHFSADPKAYRLAAVCDVDKARAGDLARKYGCGAYEHLEAFLENPELELVIIATRSLDHAAHASRALSTGKTVLLEKPIGVTAADFEILKRLDREYPGRLFFGHNHRFEPAFQNALQIMRSGLLGKIHVVKLCKHHPFMRRNDWQMRLDCGGGQLSVWGPHLIDQGLQCLGAPVRTVQSYLRRILTPGDGDDHVRLTLEGENDACVEIEISNAVALPGPYCTVYGDRGGLAYGQDQKTIRLKYLDPSFRWPEAAADAGTPQEGRGPCADEALPWREEERAVEPDTDMWDHVEIEMARHLHAALRGGPAFPVKNSEALEVVRITECMKKQNPQFRWIG